MVCVLINYIQMQIEIACDSFIHFLSLFTLSIVAGSLIYVFFGTVKEVSIGPTSLMALLTLQYTVDKPPEFAIILAFMAGCVELAMGILKLGEWHILFFFSFNLSIICELRMNAWRIWHAQYGGSLSNIVLLA